MRKGRQNPSFRTIPKEDHEHTLYHDMMQCLSSSQSSRWLTRNNGDVVNINSLRGKIVGLFFMSLTPPPKIRGPLRECLLDLASSYNELSKTKFEIVLIAQGDSESVFYHYLKMMPWLAIPFKESTARNHLYNLAEDILISTEDDEEDDLYQLVLFDCDGKLLSRDAYCLLLDTYGADCYPFTSKKIDEIWDEDNDIRANKSLIKLLWNPTRDFLIANDRTQVLISSLKNKVVGLYFCDQYGLISEFTQTLVTLYKQLKLQGREFEIVMVYTERIGWCGEEYFMQEFQYLPWLSLPYMDSNCRRLVRILNPFDCLDDNCLVIIGLGGSFVNRFGYSVVEYHGIEAYPFSRLSTAQMEKKRLEELNLISLLSSGERDYVLSMSEAPHEINISKLWGKTIFLFFIELYRGMEREALVTDLLGWCTELKEKGKNFEVVVVTSTFHEDFCKMPWLMVPLNDARVESLDSARLNCGLSLSVFGPDGKLRGIECEFHFREKKGIEPYPFDGNDLLKDVQRALVGRHMWPPASEERNQPSKLLKGEGCAIS